MIEERGPDFLGHDILWEDGDGNGFRLEMFLAKSKREPGRLHWGYVFWDLRDSIYPMFAGTDFSVPDFEDNARHIVGSLLGFLSLRDGDTDAEYFEKYTDRQRHWADTRAEELSLYADDLASEEADPGWTGNEPFNSLGHLNDG